MELTAEYMKDPFYDEGITLSPAEELSFDNDDDDDTSRRLYVFGLKKQKEATEQLASLVDQDELGSLDIAEAKKLILTSMSMTPFDSTEAKDEVYLRALRNYYSKRICYESDARADRRIFEAQQRDQKDDASSAKALGMTPAEFQAARDSFGVYFEEDALTRRIYG